MTAPVASDTVPVIVPRSLWAKAVRETRNRQNTTPSERMPDLLFFTPTIHKLFEGPCLADESIRTERPMSTRRAMSSRCDIDVMLMRANMAPMRPQKLPFKRHCLIFFAGCLILGVMSTVRVASPGRAVAASLPVELTDQQFWRLSKDSSEEDGFFRSDNLLSNETSFQYVIPALLKTAKQGGVYLGVGPEQNFTYIAALKPAMAIIIDIRHGNLDVQLMYKALFELSKDRGDFVSRLFSRKRPNGLTEKSTVSEIFTEYVAAEGNKELYEENLKAIQDVLTKKHGFPLTSGDLEGIRWALGNYYQFGPAINYSSSLSANVPPAIVGATGGNRGGNNGATYANLMVTDDGSGQNRSYLAGEENFAFVKDLEARNLVVPV